MTNKKRPILDKKILEYVHSKDLSSDEERKAFKYYTWLHEKDMPFYEVNKEMIIPYEVYLRWIKYCNDHNIFQ